MCFPTKFENIKTGIELYLDPSSNPILADLKGITIKLIESGLSQIPGVGLALAPAFGYYTSKIQTDVDQRRLKIFLNELVERLKSVEVNVNKLSQKEEFDSFLQDTVQLSIESNDKIQPFISNLVSHQLKKCKPWDEANAVLFWLKKMTSLHIQVFTKCLNAPKHKLISGKTDSDKTFIKFFSETSCPNEEFMYSITDALDEYDQSILRLIAADLRGMGLLEKTDGSDFDTEYVLQVSNAGKWLGSWVC